MSGVRSAAAAAGREVADVGATTGGTRGCCFVTFGEANKSNSSTRLVCTRTRATVRAQQKEEGAGPRMKPWAPRQAASSGGASRWPSESVRVNVRRSIGARQHRWEEASSNKTHLRHRGRRSVARLREGRAVRARAQRAQAGPCVCTFFGGAGVRKGCAVFMAVCAGGGAANTAQPRGLLWRAWPNEFLRALLRV